MISFLIPIRHFFQVSFSINLFTFRSVFDYVINFSERVGLAAMYAVHLGSQRFSFFPSDDGLSANPSKGAFLRLRHDDPYLIRVMLAGIFDDNHPYATANPIVPIPAGSFVKPFSSLTLPEKAQLLWRAQTVANSFCRDKRLLKSTDRDFKLHYLSSSDLHTAFGMFPNSSFVRLSPLF